MAPVIVSKPDHVVHLTALHASVQKQTWMSPGCMLLHHTLRKGNKVIHHSDYHSKCWHSNRCQQSARSPHLTSSCLAGRHANLYIWNHCHLPTQKCLLLICHWAQSTSLSPVTCWQSYFALLDSIQWLCRLRQPCNGCAHWTMKGDNCTWWTFCLEQ